MNEKAGDLRPTQLLHTYGVGALVDLPGFSGLVMGLQDWDKRGEEVHEDRLLTVLRRRFGLQLQRLHLPPVEDESQAGDPFAQHVGVPIATYPQWLRCGKCHTLGTVTSGLFRLDVNHFQPDRTVYRHVSCQKPGSRPAVPVRFLVGCRNGHLDDFPWVYYAHRGADCPAKGTLSLFERGPAGEAADLWVKCSCGATRNLVDAFGPDAWQQLPACTARHPHLRDFDESCDERPRTLLLGASNSWFPIQVSALTIPRSGDKLRLAVEQYWPVLEEAHSLSEFQFLRRMAEKPGRGVRPLPALAGFDDQAIWDAIGARRTELALTESGEAAPSEDLKAPEWNALTRSDGSLETRDFNLRTVAPPRGFEKYFENVVLAERLREVHALVGFTRVEARGDFLDESDDDNRCTPLSREPLTWLPAAEVRGEGIFIQFREEVIIRWLALPQVRRRSAEFLQAHTLWRQKRHIEPAHEGFPGMRYLLLHSFAHAVMRALALECGYTAASLRERVYSLEQGQTDGPRAGVLILTAATDSEGTLGGLVKMGEPTHFESILQRAFAALSVCSSDPLCAEHPPHAGAGNTIHGASCHACLFAPETSCERGNKYLDRLVLIESFTSDALQFFAPEG